MSLQPYIGITDFLDFAHVNEMEACFRKAALPGSQHMLHVGVMMSYKTLHDIPTKWSQAFPKKENIAGIFSSDNVYNCLHYACFDQDPELVDSLVQAILYGGIGIQALQLDMTWPDPIAIANAVHISRKPIDIILQIGSQAFGQVANDPVKLVEKLAEYQGIAHRVLLDKSMGRGLGLDAMALLPFARAIREAFPEMGIGAAGGLGPDTLQLVEPLFAEIKDLSVDAQGRLRPSGNALDPINWDLAKLYLERALKFFG